MEDDDSIPRPKRDATHQPGRKMGLQSKQEEDMSYDVNELLTAKHGLTCEYSTPGSCRQSQAGIPSQARFSVALHRAQKERWEGGQGTGENRSKQYRPRREGRLPLPERQKALVSCSDPRVVWSKTP